MALNIDTFSNKTGGFPFFKAIGHPAVAGLGRALVARLAEAGPVAVYDPLGFAEAFAELYDFGDIAVTDVFVQDVEEIGKTVLGRTTRPVTDLPASEAGAVLVVAFDGERLVDHIRHLVPGKTEILTLDAMRLGDDRLGNAGHYLDPLNFATNFAFFRDGPNQHCRVVTANYWHGYGARDVRLWLTLLDEDGHQLAQWDQPLANAVTSVVIDSQEVRRRFGLGDFVGQLFIHVIGAQGHDVVKYALDTYGDDARVLSCTHDANAWPADYFAGLPAPGAGERVLMWVQNSHPCPIPAGGLGLNLMGDNQTVWLDREIPPFGSFKLDVAALLPEARWPQQIEVNAGKHVVRPRYEVEAQNGRSRIAHVNVERTDLVADPKIAELGNLLGKGYLLPAPVLPRSRFRTIVLPTPMARAQAQMPVAAVVYDRGGGEVARHSFRGLQRCESVALDLDEMLGSALPGDAFGHVELVYDFADGGEADGWLHGLFRYEDRQSGHIAETSFGAHMFNSVLVYRGEPQSYAGRAPGLSTRLFLRLGPAGTDTQCHLIYAASTPWHATSDTMLMLHNSGGEVVGEHRLAIPCGGSCLWRLGEIFSSAERERAGADSYVIIRDGSCRLFGYHGLFSADDAAFSLDHMFGF